MSEYVFPYVIIGGGLAGASAVEGIRELDQNKSILLIGEEKHLPYDRPPLSKDLWLGKKKEDEIFLHDEPFYEQNKVTLALGTRAASIEINQKSMTDERGNRYRFEKLLLATGGIPRFLPVPGGNADGICYYRYLDDYLRIRPEAREGKTAVIIGGGFIGSEIAAALCTNKVSVTMIFPDAYLCSRVFPEYLGRAVQEHYVKRGIRILNGERPVSFSKNGPKVIAKTESGKEIGSDFVIAGIGILPAVGLAKAANLNVDAGKGIVVNEYLATSHPDIYAAGDNAFFPYAALGKSVRIEHWDNADKQGKLAGRNMAGAQEPYVHMPYFFSDLFEFGYEAVGEVSTELQTFADWQKENEKGVIYYLSDGRVKGVMMCNV